MRVIETLEAILLAQDEEYLLAHLRDISYFIQCAAQALKAEGTTDEDVSLRALRAKIHQD